MQARQLMLAGMVLVVMAPAAFGDEAELLRLTRLWGSACGDAEGAGKLYEVMSTEIQEGVAREVFIVTFSRATPRQLINPRARVDAAARASVSAEWETDSGGTDLAPTRLLFVREDGNWRISSIGRGGPDTVTVGLTLLEREVLAVAEQWLQLARDDDWDALYEMAPGILQATEPDGQFLKRILFLRPTAWSEVAIERARSVRAVDGHVFPDGRFAYVPIRGATPRLQVLTIASGTGLHVAREGDRWVASHVDVAALAGKALDLVDDFNAAWPDSEPDAIRKWLADDVAATVDDKQIREATAAVAGVGCGKARLVNVTAQGIACETTWHRGKGRTIEYTVVFTGSERRFEPRLARLPDPQWGAR
ncbi:MAG TPA: hypothetical protein QGH10_02785 [Armatimonadota bacterium]|nr:hypothetical protein [Armatimonadota bacterium]